MRWVASYRLPGKRYNLAMRNRIEVASPRRTLSSLLIFFLAACVPNRGITPSIGPGTVGNHSETFPVPASSLTLAPEQPSASPTRAPTPTPSPSSATPNPDWAIKSRQVDEYFASFVSDRSPGGAVIVIQDGNILHEAGYGLANVAAGTRITPAQIFHLASVGKQFTALAVLKLFEQGKLDLDDPIGNYLPELAHFGKGMTIRRLLNHTSGIPDAYSGKLLDALMERSGRPTNADLLAVLSTAEGTLFEPGFQFEYSNTGYDVLGSLIEKVSGRSYPDFLDEYIFLPLGMKHSFSLPNPRQKSDPLVAFSYVKYQGVVQPYNTYPLDDIVGSGTVYSSVEDMFLYDQALYTDALIGQTILAQAFQPGVLYNGSESAYGFGWEIKQVGGERSFAHAGKWLGYQSYYERFPDRRLSIVVLLNWNYGPDVAEVESAIRDIYWK
jgi:CubicO group peptidase (beta-lactamase class C family)